MATSQNKLHRPHRRIRHCGTQTVSDVLSCPLLLNLPPARSNLPRPQSKACIASRSSPSTKAVTSLKLHVIPKASAKGLIHLLTSMFTFACFVCYCNTSWILPHLPYGCCSSAAFPRVAFAKTLRWDAHPGHHHQKRSHCSLRRVLQGTNAKHTQMCPPR